MISQIDGKTYTRSNGQFARHLKSHGITYQEYHERYVTGVEVKCPFCDKSAKFYQRNHTYAATCGDKVCAGKLISQKYQAKDQSQKNAISQTKSDSWKTKSTSEIQSITEKRQNTLMKRYGVNHQMQLESVKQQVTQTLNQRYGHLHHTQSPTFQSQQAQTRIQQTGVSHHMQLVNVKEKVSLSLKQRHYGDLLTDLNTSHMSDLYSRQGLFAVCEHFQITRNTAYRLLREMGIGLIKTKYSSFEDGIYSWLKTLYSGEIVRSDWSLLGTQEIDLYLPSEKLAIECNGAYWHGERCGRGPSYHLDKTIKLRDLGIRLIHVFDYEWNTRRDAICGIVSRAITPQVTVPLTIVEITSDVAAQFMNKWCVHSYSASRHVAAIHNGQVLSVMALDGDDIVAYAATDGNVECVSELVKHANSPLTVKCDLSKFTGDSWANVGFELTHTAQPQCKYTHNYVDWVDWDQFTDAIWDCGYTSYKLH